MRKDLYDIIEEFDGLRLEMGYLLQANKGFIWSELEENYLKKDEFLSLMSGIEYSNQGLVNRFEKISNDMMEVYKQPCMKIEKTKVAFNLIDCGFEIRFTSYEYRGSRVALFRRGVVIAIYENRKKFEEQLKSC